MKDLEILKEVLGNLESGFAKQESDVYRHLRGMPLQDEIKFECLVALYENGFVEAQDSSNEQKRELTAPVLTADGRDLLDAMRDDKLWAQLERNARQSGAELNLRSVKAAVAESLTGGFNS